MSGFIALHREAFSHPVLKDPARFRAWFWLVANAAWKATKHDARGHTITVERGQLCAGREYLAKEWGWSPSAVERFLTRLETEQMIERQTGQMKTVITIRNYDKYQEKPEEGGHMSGQQTGQKPDRNRTAKEEGKQGNKEEELETNVSCPSDDEPALKPEHVVEAWNERAPRLGKPRVRDLTPERRQLLKARIGQYDLDDFHSVFGKIERSAFLRGDTGWSGCNFDWVFKKANFQKILEGNYDQ